MDAWVEENDLDFSRFRCCGDEDLYPFGCPQCGRVMVFCYECDTLHGDLSAVDDPKSQRWDINSFLSGLPLFDCPGCGYSFPFSFIRDGLYRVTQDQWRAAGCGHLLIDPLKRSATHK